MLPATICGLMSLSVNDLARERRRQRRKRLRRRRLLARHIALRHGPLLDRPERAAGIALEDEQESVLAGLRDHVDIAAVVLHGQQLRRVARS